MNEDIYDQYQVQDALQQSQIEAQSSALAPQLQEQIQQTQAVLVNETNPKKVVHDIMLRLKGIEERPDGTEVQVAEPKLNKVGVEAMWFWLNSHINQNIILSHFEGSEIRNMMDAIQEDLVDELSMNWKKFGIKNKTDLDSINDSILTNIKASLNRAKGQNEKNWLGKISLENISSSSRGMPVRKESFWSKFAI